MENIIRRAQLRMEIKYVKQRIEYHRHTINQLQIMGMGLTDQLNQLAKKEAANISSPLEGEGKDEGES